MRNRRMRPVALIFTRSIVRALADSDRVGSDPYSGAKKKQSTVSPAPA
jgi:hypothetical protein